MGEVPIGGVFGNKTQLFIIGNDGLCGGIRELKLPPCNSKNSQIGAEKEISIIAILSGVFGVVLLVLAFTLLWAFLPQKEKEQAR